MAEWGKPQPVVEEPEPKQPVWRRKSVVVPAAVLVLLMFVAVTGEAGGALRDENSALQERIAELQDRLEESRGEALQLAEELADADGRAGGLQATLELAEAALLEAEEALDSAPDVADLERQVEQLTGALSEAEARAGDAEERALAAEALAERTRELEQRASALDEREAALDQRDRETARAPPAPPPPAAGCQAGQVNVNTASVSELQRIHQVGPARAQQIVALRPFGSVDSLTRVSGIGPAHLAAIKGQGLACAD